MHGSMPFRLREQMFAAEWHAAGETTSPESGNAHTIIS